MIDEKKLIEKIERLENIVCGYSPSVSHVCTNLLCELKDFIKEQPKVNQWILVEERLPEKIGWYLCSNIFIPTGENTVGKLFYNGEKFIISFEEFEAIAWQPLPEPYKGVINK